MRAYLIAFFLLLWGLAIGQSLQQPLVGFKVDVSGYNRLSDTTYRIFISRIYTTSGATSGLDIEIGHFFYSRPWRLDDDCNRYEIINIPYMYKFSGAIDILDSDQQGRPMTGFNAVIEESSIGEPMYIEGLSPSLAACISSRNTYLEGGYNEKMWLSTDTLFLKDDNDTVFTVLPSGFVDKDESGRNRAFYLNNNTLFITDDSSTLSVVLPNLSSVTIDSIYFTNDTLFIVSGNDTYYGRTGITENVTNNTINEISNNTFITVSGDTAYYNILVDSVLQTLFYVTIDDFTNVGETYTASEGVWLDSLDFQLGQRDSLDTAYVTIDRWLNMGDGNPSLIFNNSLNTTTATDTVFFPVKLYVNTTVDPSTPIGEVAMNNDYVSTGIKLALNYLYQGIRYKREGSITYKVVKNVSESSVQAIVIDPGKYYNKSGVVVLEQPLSQPNLYGFDRTGTVEGVMVRDSFGIIREISYDVLNANIVPQKAIYIRDTFTYSVPLGYNIVQMYTVAEGISGVAEFTIPENPTGVFFNIKYNSVEGTKIRFILRNNSALNCEIGIENSGWGTLDSTTTVIVPSQDIVTFDAYLRDTLWIIDSLYLFKKDYFSMPFDSVTFTNNSSAVTQGELQFDNEQGFLKYGGIDDVELKVNKDDVWLVKNETGVDIPKGKLLMVVGTDGNSGHLLVDYMQASNLQAQEYVLGVSMHTILNDTFGYVMSKGILKGVNLSGYSDSTILWADPFNPGDFTTEAPQSGALKLPVAFVVSNKNNGVMAIRVKTGESLHQLHDVKFTDLQPNQILKYQTGWWVNAQDSALTELQVKDYVGEMIVDSLNERIDVDFNPSTRNLSFVVDNDLANYSNANSQFLTQEVDGDTTNELQVIDSFYLNSETLSIKLSEDTRKDVDLSSLQPTLTDGYVGYGSGSNELTGESDFTYNATNNIISLTNANAGNSVPIFYMEGTANTSFFQLKNNVASGAGRAGFRITNNEDRSFQVFMSNSDWSTGRSGSFSTRFDDDMKFVTNGGSPTGGSSVIQFVAGGNQNDPMIEVTPLNLGLGKTSPTYPVHVGQNIKLDADLIDEDGSAGTAGEILTVGTTGVKWSGSDFTWDATNNLLDISGKIAIASGENTIFIGGTNGANCVTCRQNVAIGVQALQSITTGYENFALGYDALKNLQAGGYNVAIGRSSLQNFNASGAGNNIAIGQNAGNTITTGLRNTIIGASTSNITTGSSNVLIGHNAEVLNNTDVNSIVIGGINADGLGSNTTTIGNTSTTLTRLYGDLELLSNIKDSDGNLGTQGELLTVNANGDVIWADGATFVDSPIDSVVADGTTLNFYDGGTIVASVEITDTRVDIYGDGVLRSTNADRLTFNSADFNTSTTNTTSGQVTVNLDKTGDWTGTFDGQQGTYYLDNTDDQKIDVFSLIGNNLTLSLENDGESNKIISLAGYLDNTDDQTASEVSFTPTGTISSTNVQEAIAELEGDISGITAGDFGTVGNNQLAYGSADTLTSSSSLTFNNTNKTLAINESAPFGMLSIQQNGTTDLLKFQDESGNDLMIVDGTGRLYLYPEGGQDETTSVQITHSSGNPEISLLTDDSNNVTISQSDGGLGLPNRLRFIHTGDSDKNLTYFQGGKLGVNVGSDIDQEFDVNGDARLQGALFDSTNSSGTAGQVLTSNGANAWSWETVSGGGAASLTATYVGFGDGSNQLTGSSDFTFDDATNELKITGNLELSDNSSVFIGLNVGDNETGTRYTTAVGHLAYASTSSKTGNYNSIYGSYSGRQLRGNYNCFIGAVSGSSVANVNNNLYAGYASGSYNASGSLLTSGSDNTFLGYFTRMLTNGDNNSIVIGSQAIGEGSNTTVIGNSSTTKTHLYGDLDLDNTILDGDDDTGTSGQFLSYDGVDLDWVNAPLPSLTASYIGYGSGSNELTGESALTWDATNDVLKINTNQTFTPLEISNNGNTQLVLYSKDSTKAGGIDLYNVADDDLVFSNINLYNKYNSLSNKKGLEFKVSSDADNIYFTIDSTVSRIPLEINYQGVNLNYDIQSFGVIKDSTGNSGTAGQVLTSNGNNAWSWEDASGGGGTPTLTSTYVGFGDNSNELTGSSDFTFNDATNELKITGNLELSDNNSIFIGQGVGDYETGTKLTTAIGYQAYDNSLATGGSYNSIYGAYSGRKLFAGYNSFFGAQSGNNMSAGQYNTFVGYAAGMYNVSGSFITTGNNNTLLGRDTRMISNGDNNSIVIGSEGRGEGSNTTVIGNTSTTKTHLYGDLDLDESILDGDGSAGTLGEILTVGVTGIEWSGSNFTFDKANNILDINSSVDIDAPDVDINTNDIDIETAYTFYRHNDGTNNSYLTMSTTALELRYGSLANLPAFAIYNQSDLLETRLFVDFYDGVSFHEEVKDNNQNVGTKNQVLSKKNNQVEWANVRPPVVIDTIRTDTFIVDFDNNTNGIFEIQIEPLDSTYIIVDQSGSRYESSINFTNYENGGVYRITFKTDSRYEVPGHGTYGSNHFYIQPGLFRNLNGSTLDTGGLWFIEGGDSIYMECYYNGSYFVVTTYQTF